MDSQFSSTTAPADDLIARYLHAIGKHLPASRREDILAEISANLIAEVEDREAALGRALNKTEQAELLKAHDRPFLVAARYRPQQYLIGPTVFPYYWLILRIALVVSAFAYFLSGSILLGVQGVTAAKIGGMIARFPYTALLNATIVTAIFAALEWAVSRHEIEFPERDGWKPEALPLIHPSSRNQIGVLAGLVAHLGGILWLAVAPFHPYLVLGPGAGYFTGSPVHATPALWAIYWPLVGLLFLPLLIETGVFLHSLSGAIPSSRQRLLMHIFNRSATLVGLALALRVHEYFTVIGTAADQAKYAHAVEVYTSITVISLRVGFAICLFGLVWTFGRRLFKSSAPALSFWKTGAQL